MIEYRIFSIRLEHLQLHNALQHWLHSMALCISKLFYLWLTPADPCKIFDPINALHSGLGVISTNIWWPQGILKEFDLWLTLADLCMTFDLSNALRAGHGFFPPNLVAIGHCLANWPLFDPSWPLHDLWPQQCITLWSVILPTKFGGHRAFLSNLTSP